MSKKEEAKRKLEDEFDMIQGGTNLGDFDISKHLANMEDLPNLGNIQLYDYESDIIKSEQMGIDILNSLVDLYLGEFPDLKTHPYIKNKLKEDAMVYAETIFLQKMTKRNFLTQMKQVDNGDNSARMHEVINQTISQIRENSKYASGQRTDLEKFYKDFRNDMIEVIKSVSTPTAPEESKDSNSMDSRKLNDLIEKAIKDKKNNG